jgi:hypothetical protein
LLSLPLSSSGTCLTHIIHEISIPIVKLEDRQLAKTVGVFALSAIVVFRYMPNSPNS